MVYESSAGNFMFADLWPDNNFDIKNPTKPEHSLRPGRRFKFTRNAVRYTGDHNK